MQLDTCTLIRNGTAAQRTSSPRTRPRTCIGAMKWFRRKHDQPWEVVGCETVEPVLMFDETGDSRPAISRSTL